MPALPDVVQQTGVTVSKSTRNYLLIAGVVSEDGSMDNADLNDYTVSKIESVIGRVPGVGEVQVFGTAYSMRVWLDPDKLTKYGMTSDDVVAALRAYNVEVSAGQLGGAPAVPGQRLNASILVQSLLKTPEEFAAVPLRTNPDGSVVKVKDVGRTELGTEIPDLKFRFNGKPAGVFAVRQEAGANALETADRVKAKMTELSRFFPPGMKAIFVYDTTPFVKVAIDEVFKTLLEAIVLVFLVMYLFLGNFRATLIPTIAVPVVLLGTFGVLGFLGYSINMLTMFAMVLAIGLLVDDAIVVVENVERIMSEEGLPPFEATRKSMDQITSALVGIGLVLSAVFGPMIFFPGSTGVIYRQFSVTVIASMLLSVLVALILTPVLCASLLRPVAKGHEAAETGIRFLRPFFLWFDRFFFRPRPVRGGSRTRPRSARPLRRRLPRHRRIDGGPLSADADRVPPRRGPGDPDGDGPAPRRLDARADRGGDGRGGTPLPRRPEGRREVVRSGRGNGLLGARPEPGNGLRPAQGLEAPGPPGPEGQGRGREGDAGPLGPARRDHLRLPASRRRRARHRDRAST